MSDLEAPPAPQNGAPVGEPPSEVPFWLLGTVGVVILALAAVLVLAVTQDDSKGTDGDVKSPSYPLTWDSRIAPYAEKGRAAA